MVRLVRMQQTGQHINGSIPRNSLGSGTLPIHKDVASNPTGPYRHLGLLVSQVTRRLVFSDDETDGMVFEESRNCDINGEVWMFTVWWPVGGWFHVGAHATVLETEFGCFLAFDFGDETVLQQTDD